MLGAAWAWKLRIFSRKEKKFNNRKVTKSREVWNEKRAWNQCMWKIEVLCLSARLSPLSIYMYISHYSFISTRHTKKGQLPSVLPTTVFFMYSCMACCYSTAAGLSPVLVVLKHSLPFLLPQGMNLIGFVEFNKTYTTVTLAGLLSLAG